MSEVLKSAEFEGKTTFKLPEGTTIVKKTIRLTVEEIENGFIIRKSFDINYTNAEGESKYEYITKKWFSKKNPIKIEESKEMPLEDKL